MIINIWGIVKWSAEKIAKIAVAIVDHADIKISDRTINK